MKAYNSLDEIIPDLFQLSDVVILWGKRGNGKSSLQGKLMSEFMKPRNAKQDIRGCHAVCDRLNDAGFHFHPPEDHTVFCDTFFENRGYLTRRATAYQFNPVRFTMPNSVHESVALLPYGRYFFDEAQDLFDSHLGSLPTFITKTFELSRHPHLFICISLQRPMRIHKDIRDLATFVEVVGKKNRYNKYGRLVSTTWDTKIIYDNARLEQYLSSKDESLVDKHAKFEFTGDIYRCYDSNFFLPMFYRGFENADFELEHCERVEMSVYGFEKYFDNRVMEIPETYRGKKTKQKEKKDEGKQKA